MRRFERIKTATPPKEIELRNGFCLKGFNDTQRCPGTGNVIGNVTENVLSLLNGLFVDEREDKTVSLK